MRVLYICAASVLAGIAVPVGAQERPLGASHQGKASAPPTGHLEPRLRAQNEALFLPVSPIDELFDGLSIGPGAVGTRGDGRGLRFSVKPGRGVRAVALLRF